jgi:hypothetical protein
VWHSPGLPTLVNMYHSKCITRDRELPYDWRFTANQFVLGTSPLRLTTSDFCQLNTCGQSPYVTRSLMRGWVCHSQFLLAFSSAVILRSESRGTHDILLSQIRDSSNLQDQVPVFIWPSYTPRHWVPFS